MPRDRIDGCIDRSRRNRIVVNWKPSAYEDTAHEYICLSLRSTRPMPVCMMSDSIFGARSRWPRANALAYAMLPWGRGGVFAGRLNFFVSCICRLSGSLQHRSFRIVSYALSEVFEFLIRHETFVFWNFLEFKRRNVVPHWIYHFQCLIGSCEFFFWVLKTTSFPFPFISTHRLHDSPSSVRTCKK